MFFCRDHHIYNSCLLLSKDSFPHSENVKKLSVLFWSLSEREAELDVPYSNGGHVMGMSSQTIRAIK